MIKYESEYYGIVHMDIDVIEHHGILGQRWGKKNGPPYPLGADDHSALERKLKKVDLVLTITKSLRKLHSVSRKISGSQNHLKQKRMAVFCKLLKKQMH